MKQTKYPGIKRLADGRFHIRVTGRCPKTGKKKNSKMTVECQSLGDAVRIREEMRVAIEQADADDAAERVRVEAAAISWLTGKRSGLKPSTAERYALALDHALADLGEIYLDRLSRADIIAWRDSQDAAASTTNSRLRVLKTFLADVCAERELRNPAERVRALSERVGDDVVGGSNILEGSELSELLAALSEDEHWYPVFLFMATTGTRFGEMAAVRWMDVDFAAARVVIRRGKWKQTVGTTKTGRARSVPLVEPLAKALRSLRDTRTGAKEHDLVFPTSKGTMLSNGSVRGALLRGLERAGITKRFTLHGFRRTFNNLVRREATSTMVVQALTGHSTDRMTEHYSFIGDAEKRSAMASLAQVIPIRPQLAGRDTAEVSPEVSRAPDGTKTDGRG